MGTEKVAEQHILVKSYKCSHFRVISNLLKVASSTNTHFATCSITHLAMDLDLQLQEKYLGHK